MQRLNKLFPLTRQLTSPSTRSFFSRNSPWGLVDVSRQMEDMDKLIGRMEREMSAAFRDVGRESPFNRLWNILEPFSPTSRFASSPRIEVETVPINGDKGTKYIMKMDMGPNYSPEDVKVSLKDRVLTIQAKLDKKSTTADGESRIYQEVSRSFTLPEAVNVEEVKSLFTSDGILTIEAPLPEVQPPKPREIPISVESTTTSK